MHICQLVCVFTLSSRVPVDDHRCWLLSCVQFFLTLHSLKIEDLICQFQEESLMQQFSSLLVVEGWFCFFCCSQKVLFLFLQLQVFRFYSCSSFVSPLLLLSAGFPKFVYLVFLCCFVLGRLFHLRMYLKEYLIVCSFSFFFLLVWLEL